MTPSEFKAWFDGFTEAFGNKLPTKQQWGRIKERVAEIDGKPITEKVFVDRWYPYWHHHYPYYQTGILGYQTGTLGYGTCSGALLSTQSSLSQATFANAIASPALFDSAVAMNAVGRAEAASLTE